MKLFISNSNDPFLNLAMENQLLEKSEQSSHLFIWCNRPSVILGRFQNPWLECDLHYLTKNNILLARRQSGGGCVFHDQGNLNFSFMGPKLGLQHQINKADHFQLMLRMLESFDIKAEINQRNDIVIGGHKVSGSAFKNKRLSAFHHLTLLVESNQKLLVKSLNSPFKSGFSKAVRSKKSATINLASINSQLTVAKILFWFKNEFKHACQDVTPESQVLSEQYYSDIRSNLWIYGETPLFNMSADPWTLSFNKGQLVEISTQATDIPNNLTLELNQSLKGVNLWITEMEKKFLIDEKIQLIETQFNYCLDPLKNLFKTLITFVPVRENNL